MAKLFLLTKEQVESGQRPKTPRDKLKDWRRICFVLSALIILEHAIVLTYWLK